jgi:ankyrin repeat protein
MACYFNRRSAVQRLLKLGVNIDAQDYQGKTSLHRCRHVDMIRVSRSFL